MTQDIIFIDFETSQESHQAREFAFVKFSFSGKMLDYAERYYTQKKKFLHNWKFIDKKLSNQVIAAHNIGFDKTCLLKAFPFFQAQAYLDTLSICRQCFGKNIKDYSLNSLIKIFKIDTKIAQAQLNKQFFAHHALYDAYACGILLTYLIETYLPIKNLVLQEIDKQGL